MGNYTILGESEGLTGGIYWWGGTKKGSLLVPDINLIGAP